MLGNWREILIIFQGNVALFPALCGIMTFTMYRVDGMGFTGWGIEVWPITWEGVVWASPVLNQGLEIQGLFVERICYYGLQLDQKHYKQGILYRHAVIIFMGKQKEEDTKCIYKKQLMQFWCQMWDHDFLQGWWQGFRQPAVLAFFLSFF